MNTIPQMKFYTYQLKFNELLAHFSVRLNMLNSASNTGCMFIYNNRTDGSMDNKLF